MNDLYIVANFGEIFLKGKNISFFEKRLLKNLKENLGDFLKNVIFEKVAGGSFYIKLNNNLKEKDILDIENIVKNTPGFISFFRAYFVESDLEKIKEKAAELTEKEIENNNNIRTFAVSSERSEKEASLGSKESNIKVGSAI